MSQKLPVFTDNIDNFLLVLYPFSPLFFFQYIFARDNILFVVVDCATLSSVKFDSVDNLIDSIHCYHLLNILLFEKSMQSYLELLIILYISLQ